MTNRFTSPILIVAGVGNAADLRYRSGFMPVDPIVFLDAGAECLLVVPMLEAGRAMNEATGCDVRTPQQLGIPRSKRRRFGEWALAALRDRGIRRVRVPADFPAAVLRRIERAGIRVSVVEGDLYPQRAKKTRDEIACIAESQRAAVAAMHRAVATIRSARINRAGFLVKGGRKLTSEDVRREVDIELLSRNCQARDTIIAGGRKAADPHDRGHGPLRAHETIVLDIFPQHRGHGYWGDITRTVCRGTPTPFAQKAFDAVASAQRHALREIRAGIRADRIHEGVQSVLSGAGFKTETRNGVPVGFFHGTGHGVGLEIHEAPSLSTVPVKLVAGNVVTVEPGLYDPEWGGIRIEDTVAVTREGCDILAPCRIPFML